MRHGRVPLLGAIAGCQWQGAIACENKIALSFHVLSCAVLSCAELCLF